MWEFFLGISLACFFAVYWIMRGSKPKTRLCEAVYAPHNEVLEYKTRKKSSEYVSGAPHTSESFEETEPPIINAAPSYRAPRVPEPKPFTYPEKDEFVEYAASVVTEEPAINAAQSANITGELPKSAPKDAENEDETNEKKPKYNSFRFFNS